MKKLILLLLFIPLYNFAFIGELHIYSYIIIAFIFIMWYIDLYLIKRKDVNWNYEDFSDSNEKKSVRWLSFGTLTTRKKALRNILMLVFLSIPFIYITTIIATKTLGISYELWDKVIICGFQIWILFILINLYKFIVGDYFSY